MSGSVSKYRTAQGVRYKARYDLPVPPGMPRRQAAKSGFRTRADANAHLHAMQRAAESGAAPSSMTLAQWLDAWCPAVSVTTANEYAKVQRTWLRPLLGNVRLRDLATEHVEALHAALGARSSKTVRNVHGVLRSALRDAEARGLVSHNVAARVRPPGSQSAEMAIWDVAELGAWLEIASHAPLAPAWRLIATTGMRRGEVCALQVEDFAESSATLTVRRSASQIDGQLLIKSPKSRAGLRTLGLDCATAAMLSEWIDEQRLPPTARVFDIWPGALSMRFRRMVERTALPRIRLHDVRHTYATLALSQCRTMADVKTLSRRLGHSSVTITLDTYSHGIAEQDARLADAVAELLG